MNSSKPVLQAFAMAIALHTVPSPAAVVTVPGTADPWLAGMPDGSTASSGDVAPAQSPVFVAGLPLEPGSFLTFTVTGGVAYAAGYPISPPDGSVITGHQAGAQNGLSDVIAPADALMGVFLGPVQPSLSPAPGTLDFSTPSSRDYLTLTPELQQVFFIGDGVSSGAVKQQIHVPLGATRLFLGGMDGSGWYNNIGSFRVTVVAYPSLSIQRLDTTQARIAWPTNASAYVLEWAASLPASGWTVVTTNRIAIEGENFTITEDTQVGPRFFRLRKLAE